MTWLNKILRSDSNPTGRPAAADDSVLADAGPAAAEARPPSQDLLLLDDKASALSCLAGLTDEDSLVEVALQARFAEVRLGAARRLTSGAALERVAQASRDKDKGVYRHCSTILQQRQAASACSVRAAALEDELARLLAEEPVPAARLVDLEKDFRQLEGIDLSRCTELIAQLRERVQAQGRQLQQLHASQLAAQGLAAELALPAPITPAQLPQLQERWRTLADSGAAWPAWLAGHKEAKALAQQLSQIEMRLMAAAEDLLRLGSCEAFLAGHAGDAVLSEEARVAWEALAKPDHPQLCAELQARWEVCLQRLVAPVAAAPEPPPPPAKRAARDHPQLAGLIQQLAEAIEQGHLAAASKLDAEIAKLETASALPHGQAHKLAGVRAQLLKLRGWARWGSDQARQQLILQAEQLAQDKLDVDSLAKAITKLRQEWKSLDAHGASNKTLWQQFDSAVEKAYAPVAAHRAELAARLQAARKAKEALCLEWENWLAQIVWEHADIKVIQTMRQEICDAWRAVGAQRERRSLHKRFEAVLAVLDARIDAARQQEISRCEALIAAAQDLRQNTRLHQAIEGIKKLQQRWRDEAHSVRLARAEQVQLWQRFRSACDAVFARRAEEKAQQSAQRAQNREAAQRRLAELQAALDNQEIAQVQQCITAFRNAWREEKPGNMPAPARDALQRAEAHLEALQASKRQAPFRLLAQKIALAEQIEGAAAAGADSASVGALLAEAQATWQTLPRLPAKFEQPLALRLAAAPGATAASLVTGAKLRETILLDLEIALDLNAASHEEVRRARNLQLLQQKFRRDQPPPVDLEKLVTQWHAQAAAPDPLQQQRMAVILQSMKSLQNTGL